MLLIVRNVSLCTKVNPYSVALPGELLRKDELVAGGFSEQAISDLIAKGDLEVTEVDTLPPVDPDAGKNPNPVKHTGKWQRDPATLLGLSLVQLQALVAEEQGEETVPVPQDIEAAITQLSLHFKPEA